MARPLRLEFAGALYHVTARGDRREDFFEDDEDREAFLSLFANVADRFNWLVHAYCLMSNHYHLLIETPDSNLSKGIRQLNGVYTQYSNRRHRRIGHLFQGRLQGHLGPERILSAGGGTLHLLNPVRAQMVRSAGDWPWRSYRATAGPITAPSWLADSLRARRQGGRGTDRISLIRDRRTRPTRAVGSIGSPGLPR